MCANKSTLNKLVIVLALFASGEPRPLRTAISAAVDVVGTVGLHQSKAQLAFPVVRCSNSSRMSTIIRQDNREAVCMERYIQWRRFNSKGVLDWRLWQSLGHLI